MLSGPPAAPLAPADVGRCAYGRGMPPTPPSQRAGPRWRRRVWRHRHLLAAGVLALSGWTALSELRPPPPATEQVLVLARDRSAGVELTAADLELAQVATPLVPSGVLRQPDEALGARLALGLPAGLPLTEHLLAGPGLAAGAPPGHVVVPVRLADPAMAALLRPGDAVDLLTAAADAAGSAGGAEVVAAGALVMSLQHESGGGLLAAEPTAPLVLVALPAESATAVVGANAWAPLRLVLPRTNR